MRRAGDAMQIRWRLIVFWSLLFYGWYTAAWWVEALSATGLRDVGP
jgi:hypothetical protein